MNLCSYENNSEYFPTREVNFTSVDWKWAGCIYY